MQQLKTEVNIQMWKDGLNIPSRKKVGYLMICRISLDILCR